MTQFVITAAVVRALIDVAMVTIAVAWSLDRALEETDKW